MLRELSVPTAVTGIPRRLLAVRTKKRRQAAVPQAQKEAAILQAAPNIRLPVQADILPAAVHQVRTKNLRQVAVPQAQKEAAILQAAPNIRLPVYQQKPIVIRQVLLQDP